MSRNNLEDYFMFMEKAGMIARLVGAIRLVHQPSVKLRKCIWTIPTSS